MRTNKSKKEKYDFNIHILINVSIGKSATPMLRKLGKL